MKTINRKETILVVDDNKNNRDMLEVYLEMEDFKVCFAKDGKQGLRRTWEVMPDIILLDIMMPVMDELEMLEILKADPVLTGIPVIILTANAKTDDVVLALEMGADDYFKKPYDVDELIARINKLIEQKHDQAPRNKIFREHQKSAEYNFKTWSPKKKILQKQFKFTLMNGSGNIHS